MEPLFRNSMVGFNKGDVTDFIAKLSLRNERALMEKEKEIENLKDETEKLSCRISELERMAEAKSASDAENAALLAKIRKACKELKNESLAFSELTLENCARVEKMDSDISLLSDRCEKLGAYKEKAGRFDRLASVLSGIVTGDEKAPQEVEAPQEEEVPLELQSRLSASHFLKQKDVASSISEKLDQLDKLAGSLHGAKSPEEE